MIKIEVTYYSLESVSFQFSGRNSGCRSCPTPDVSVQTRYPSGWENLGPDTWENPSVSRPGPRPSGPGPVWDVLPRTSSRSSPDKGGPSGGPLVESRRSRFKCEYTWCTVHSYCGPPRRRRILPGASGHGQSTPGSPFRGETRSQRGGSLFSTLPEEVSRV